jgi:hypothetical protein
MTDHRRTAWQRLLVLVATVFALTASLVSAAPAHAAAKPPLRYLPIAGSAKLLVYEAIRSADLLSVYQAASQYTDVYALTRSGHRISLGQLGNNGGVSVVGSNIVIDSAQDNAELVRWWDVANGKHGHFESVKGRYGAAPHGWVYDTFVGGDRHLVSQTYAGVRTDLGDPMQAGTDYSVQISASGVVATGNNDEDSDGRIRYMSWSRPGVFRTLYSPPSMENECGVPSSQYAACTIDFGPTALLPVTGGKRTVKRVACVREVTTFGSLAVWVDNHESGCPSGRLGAVSPTGKVNYAAQRFSPDPPIIALGRIVVARSDQRALLTLTGVSAAPRELVPSG